VKNKPETDETEYARKPTKVQTFVINQSQTINEKHWDNAYLRQGTSYQCRDTDPDPYQDL